MYVIGDTRAVKQGGIKMMDNRDTDAGNLFTLHIMAHQIRLS